MGQQKKKARSKNNPKALHAKGRENLTSIEPQRFCASEKGFSVSSQLPCANTELIPKQEKSRARKKMQKQ